MKIINLTPDPTECHNRADAIRIFAKYKCYGELDIGNYQDAENEFTVWRCRGKKETMFLEIFKDAGNVPFTSDGSEDFILYENDSYFIERDIFFYITPNGFLHKTIMLHNADAADCYIRIKSEYSFDSLALYAVTLPNQQTSSEKICWVGYGKDQPALLFPAFLEKDYIKQKTGIHQYKCVPIKNGDTFDASGLTRELNTENNRQELTCIGISNAYYDES